MKEKKQRGFFGKVAVFLLALMAIVGLIAMGLSVVNAFINPQRFIWTTMFGLAFGPFSSSMWWCCFCCCCFGRSGLGFRYWHCWFPSLALSSLILSAPKLKLIVSLG